MKTPLVTVLSAGGLWLLYLFYGRQVDIAFCAIILFGTGLVAWTLEQYEQHHPH
jgi:hypothetical protein